MPKKPDRPIKHSAVNNQQSARRSELKAEGSALIAIVCDLTKSYLPGKLKEKDWLD
jgi:hypothetical protein